MDQRARDQGRLPGFWLVELYGSGMPFTEMAVPVEAQVWVKIMRFVAGMLGGKYV